MADPYVGEIKLFSFDRIPDGWHACNGDLLQIQQNQALFSLISNFYGGDGQKTFAVPDLRGRAPLGAYGAFKTKPYGLAVADGSDLVQLTSTQLPAHNHALQAITTPGTLTSVKNAVYASVQQADKYNLYAAIPSTGTPFPIDSSSFVSTGGGHGHNNMQPYLAMTYCIAVSGVYPPRPN